MLDEPKRVPETNNEATAGVNAAPTVGKIVARIAPILGVAPKLPGDQPKFDAKVARLLLKGRLSRGRPLRARGCSG